MNQKEVIPCVLYFYIHNKLKEKFSKGVVVTTKEAMSYLFEWRIPENIRPIIIKELEILGLIERVGRRSIKINSSSFELDDLREFYKELGIY